MKFFNVFFYHRNSKKNSYNKEDECSTCYTKNEDKRGFICDECGKEICIDCLGKMAKLTWGNFILCPVCRTGVIGHFTENIDGIDEDRFLEV